MSDDQQGQRLKYVEVSPGGVGAMRALEHYLNVESGLEPVLLELVRLRASLMNGCTFCIGLHRKELAKHNEPDTRVDAVEGWRESDAFTERERSALAWTETVTNVQEGHVPDEAFTAVREHFSEKELVDLTVAISSINAWNRIAIAFRVQWDASKAGGAGAAQRESGNAPAGAMGEDGEQAVVDDDGGKVSVDEQ